MFCAVCLQKAPYRCTGCKKIYYCSETHQLEHWNAIHFALCKAIVLAGPQQKRKTKQETDEEDEDSHVSKLYKESCPRDLEQEQKTAFREALGGISDEEVRELEGDQEINHTCKKIVENAGTLSNLCKDFMQPHQIEAIMLNIYNSRREGTKIDQAWKLPELFRALTQYHEAYFRLLYQDEPTSDSGVRTLSAHLSTLTEDFVEFYKSFCPYISKFASNTNEGRDELFIRLQSNISKIDTRVDEIEMGSGLTSIPRRTLRGIYKLMCIVTKVFCGKMVALVTALISITPYHMILSSDKVNSFVISLQNMGYVIPREYFDLRNENFLGIMSTASHYASWWNSSGANPWVQTGINAVFRFGIMAINISNTLQALVKHGIAFFCSQLLQRMGFHAFAAAITSSVASHVFTAGVIYFAWRAYEWYRQYREDEQMKEQLADIGRRFRLIVTEASLMAKQ